MIVPAKVKLYHITHLDNLPYIVKDGFLFSEAELRKRPPAGVSIGMKAIKDRRLKVLTLASHPELHVGECVPFYFCPRSIMLFMYYKRNHKDIEYHGGQEPIVHLVSDLYHAVDWADRNRHRWVFTNSNAGTTYFEDFADLCDLEKIDWKAVHSTQWSDRDIKEMKQAEFLIEGSFPWGLVEEIGVYSTKQQNEILKILDGSAKLPIVRVQKSWYY